MKFSEKEIIKLQKKAKELRWNALEMIVGAKGSHIGPAFSMIELVMVLYEKVLRYDPKNPLKSDRDRFILSKAHGCAALYVVLADKKFFNKTKLEHLQKSNFVEVLNMPLDEWNKLCK